MLVEPPPRLLRLSQVAAMMQVHPKTVYYWVRTGRLAALTSPGGLLRVRPEDARALCQKAGLSIPAELENIQRRAHLYEPDLTAQRAVRRALEAKGLEVTLFEDAYEAMIATARDAPEMMLLSATAAPDIAKFTVALHRDPRGRRTRVFALGVDDSTNAALAEAGVTAVVGPTDATAVGKLLQ